MKLKSKEERKGEKVFRYSIRKYHFGAASVAVAALMFFANGTVQAQTPEISPATENGTTRTSALVSDSSGGGGVSKELSEETPDTDPSQPEQPIQGNQKPQEASDENQSLAKTSEEGKGEKQAEEASRPTVDKSLAQSAQTSLQALLTNLTLDSMKELHARVEAGLAQAKAVLENPNSSQEEVNAQVQAMKTLTEEVNKALAGGLTSPAELGEGSGATQSEPSPTPRRGRGRRGQLTPPAMLAPAENQETKETTEEVTDYTNGQGSYPLSEEIHKLLQELKTSTENSEQVQKLKEAYDKLNEALGQSENGLVNQEVFNAALEEYKRAAQLKNGVEKGSSDIPKSRKERSVDNSLKIGFGKGTTSVPQYSEETLRTLSTGEAYGNNLRITVKSFSGKTVRSITVNGLQGTGLSQTGLTLTNGLGYVDLRGRMPVDRHGYTRVTVVATDSSGNTNQTTLTIARPLPDARITTTNKELEGKAETQPIISGTIGVKAEPGNTPDGAELMAYLVRGGSPNPYSYNNEAQGYHTIAKTRVSVSGTFNFVPPEYRDSKLGEGDVRVVVAYVHKGTDTVYSEGMKSGFSTNSVRATAPIDKSNLSTKTQELETELNKPVSLDGKTEDSKRAYEQAKEAAKRAVAKAKEVQQDGTATEDKVREAESGLAQAKTGLETAKNGLRNVDKNGSQTPASPSDTAQSGTSPVTPPSATRNRRTPPRRARRSVGFVGNSQTGTNPSAVDKSELRTLVEDLERRLQDLAGLSPEVLEEAQRILGEAQAALDNENLTAQELADLLAKVRQVLNSLQTGTSADKSQSASNLNKEAESTKGAKNETEVPLYGVLGAAVLSLLGALLFAVARKKSSQLDKLSRELHQLVVELEASDKDKKVLNKAKKLADEARLFVDSHQKDSQKEAELISEIKTVLSQLKEEF